MLKTISEKDKRIHALTGQIQGLHSNNSLLEEQLQLLRATVAAMKEENKLDYKKQHEELSEHMNNLSNQLSEVHARMDSLKEDNKRYRKEREEYKSLYEKSTAKEVELNERLTVMIYEMGKLKFRQEYVDNSETKDGGSRPE
jgi:chromosome segregation ATPase